MKYAFNTWAYSSFPSWLPCYPLDEAIRRLAAIGYDGVEIGCAAPHAWPAYLNKERRAELRNLLETSGLQPVSLLATPGGGPGFNPASPLAEEREATVRYYNEVVDLALDLGAEKVLYIAGWQIFGTSRQQAWDRSKDCLDRIASHADKKGITIVVEPTAAATRDTGGLRSSDARRSSARPRIGQQSSDSWRRSSGLDRTIASAKRVRVYRIPDYGTWSGQPSSRPGPNREDRFEILKGGRITAELRPWQMSCMCAAFALRAATYYVERPEGCASAFGARAAY